MSWSMLIEKAHDQLDKEHEIAKGILKEFRAEALADNAPTYHVPRSYLNRRHYWRDGKWQDG